MGHASQVVRNRSTEGSHTEAAPSRPELEREVGELLLNVAEGLRRRSRALVEHTELKLPDLQMLHVLQQAPLRMGELADELGYDASHITALVDRMEGLGYVERQGDPHDRRVKRIVLTPAGRRRTKSVEQQVFGATELFDRLTGPQLRQLAELLRRAVG